MYLGIDVHKRYAQLVKIDTLAAEFYALNGESVLQFPSNQERMDLCVFRGDTRAESALTDSARVG